MDPGGGGPGSGSDPGSGSNPGSGDGTISGAITSDQTWTGKVTIGGNTTINPGVTVTVASGTMIEGKTGATVHVQGTLDIQGTKDAVVTILPVQGATTWPGFVADQGGNLNMTHVMGTNIATLVYCHAGATCALDHVEFSSMANAIIAEGTATITASRLSQVMNGGVTVQNGDLKIVDSYILTSQGDIIIQNGGNLDISYSEVGDAQGSYEHCDFHINSAAKLSITHSNIRNGVYGMMIGGTTNAIIQYDNFVKNGKGTDIEAIGANTNADFQYDYWDQGAPTMAGGNFANTMGTMITDAGPRAANL
ncbi:MAG TPA: hypothetical protein VL463_13915 [Kofleriaceae bacterium]|nr:hypothetical protein [Kofleriaceae bacterium]